MTFVYILQSELDASRFYIGLSDDPERRHDERNSSKSIHTNTFRP
jgi:predicted GIY-YIG superfamily endonuclease